MDYSNYAARLAQTTDCWDLVDEFIRDWNLTGPYTWEIDPARWRKAEAELGFRFPVEFVRWCEFGFRPLRLWALGFQRNVYPETFGERAKDGYITFYTDHSDTHRWAIRAYDESPEVPVFIGWEEDEPPYLVRNWTLQNRSISEFALQRVMMDVLMGAVMPDHWLNVPYAPEATILSLRGVLPEIGLRPEGYFGYTLLGGPDVIACISQGEYSSYDEAGSWTAIAGRSADALRWLTEQVPADWQRHENLSRVETGNQAGWDGQPREPADYQDPFLESERTE